MSAAETETSETGTTETIQGPRLFGTDGVRGVFGREPMDEATLRRLGAALADRLLERAAAKAVDGPAPCVVLGGDTRDSTPQICRWLAAELGGRGLETIYLGTLPTPGVAAVTASTGAACGLAVSASHNPHPDNGVKLIDTGGFKWPPGDEARLEARMADPDLEVTGGEAVLEVDRRRVDAYLEGLARSLGERRLDGLRIGLDAGHGAASPFARPLFEALGAEVTLLGDEPDGRNINQGRGSTHPDLLAERVRELGLAMGVAFDGDADRAILVDERGEVRDGDAMLYLWAHDLHRRDELRGAVVATSMSNLGLEVALRESGLELVRCDVGDREVVRTLEERGLVLGGEQSGHIVNLDLATTGDGLLTALHMAALVHAADDSLSALLQGLPRFPQLLRNLRVERKPPLETLPRVAKAVAAVEAELGDRGRLVLRYSGTEPLVRIMLEGPDRATIDRLADRLEAVLAEELT